MSNNIDLPQMTSTSIVQYQGVGSTLMFKEVLEDGFRGKVDLFDLDSRLTAGEAPLLEQLAPSSGVIALDDFEGVEKGVANVFVLRAGGCFPGNLLICPTAQPLLEKMGFTDHCSTALLVPSNQIAFSAK